MTFKDTTKSPVIPHCCAATDLQDLSTPGFQHFGVDLLEPPNVGLERAGRHQFRHHDKVFLAGGILVLPSIVEADDVRML